MTHALPCIICDKPLRNIATNGENQPSGGTEFTTHGHYGSTVFDPMDGSILVLNICDDCLRKHAGRVGHYGMGMKEDAAFEYRSMGPWKP